MRHSIYVVIGLMLAMASCRPVDRSAVDRVVPLDKTYRSSIAKDAYDHGDQRNLDSIVSFLHSNRPIENYQAIKVAQSFYDSSMMEGLLHHLSTPYPSLQKELLYAIGQTLSLIHISEPTRPY